MDWYPGQCCLEVCLAYLHVCLQGSLFRAVLFEEDGAEEHVNESTVGDDEVGGTEAAAREVDLSNKAQELVGPHEHEEPNAVKMWVCCSGVRLAVISWSFPCLL